MESSLEKPPQQELLIRQYQEIPDRKRTGATWRNPNRVPTDIISYSLSGSKAKDRLLVFYKSCKNLEKGSHVCLNKILVEPAIRGTQTDLQAAIDLVSCSCLPLCVYHMAHKTYGGNRKVDVLFPEQMRRCLNMLGQPEQAPEKMKAVKDHLFKWIESQEKLLSTIVVKLFGVDPVSAKKFSTVGFALKDGAPLDSIFHWNIKLSRYVSCGSCYQLKSSLQVTSCEKDHGNIVVKGIEPAAVDQDLYKHPAPACQDITDLQSYLEVYDSRFYLLSDAFAGFKARVH